MEQEIKEHYEQFRDIVDVFDRTFKMETEIYNQTTENREIEERCNKYSLSYTGKSKISTGSTGSDMSRWMVCRFWAVKRRLRNEYA